MRHYSGLAKYFAFYNTERLHSSLSYMTSYEIYFKEQDKYLKKQDEIKEQANS